MSKLENIKLSDLIVYSRFIEFTKKENGRNYQNDYRSIQNNPHIKNKEQPFELFFSIKDIRSLDSTLNDSVCGYFTYTQKFLDIVNQHIFLERFYNIHLTIYIRNQSAICNICDGIYISSVQFITTLEDLKSVFDIEYTKTTIHAYKFEISWYTGIEYLVINHIVRHYINDEILSNQQITSIENEILKNFKIDNDDSLKQNNINTDNMKCMLLGPCDSDIY